MNLHDGSTPKAIIIGNPDGSPFDIKGKQKWIAVGLASTRSKQKFGTFGWDSPLPNVIGPTPTITATTDDATMNGYYPAEVNDSKHNSDVWMTTEGTDYDGIRGVPAVRHCRSISLGGTPMDCPNVDCLMRIFKLKDFIDSHDPTAGANSVYKLSNWGFGETWRAVVWASSESATAHTWSVDSDGSVSIEYVKFECGVVPVQEILA